MHSQYVLSRPDGDVIWYSGAPKIDRFIGAIFFAIAGEMWNNWTAGTFGLCSDTPQKVFYNMIKKTLVTGS